MSIGLDLAGIAIVIEAGQLHWRQKFFPNMVQKAGPRSNKQH